MQFAATLDSFVSLQLKLLELEREAEIEENKCLYESCPVKKLQDKGLCISKVKISQTWTGLFGRPMIKFVPKFDGNVFPAHAVSSGDIIGICLQNSDGKVDVKLTGVVSVIHDAQVTVVLEKDSSAIEFEDNDVYSLVKLANDVTYKRLKRILKTLETKGNEIYLTSVLFGTETPSVLQNSHNDLTFYNQNLNDSQKTSVRFALSQKQVAVLHGPPGTGKTTTLIECIMQCIYRKSKVLACAPSNIAVDNLIEKLVPYKIKMVRLGHPARASEDIQKFCLDSIVSNYDGCDVLREMQTEMVKLKDKIDHTKGPKKFLWNENKTLLKDIKERQKNIVKQIINNADIVLATLTSASEDGPLKYAEKDHFDVCFIDECSQALEVACWIPLALVKKCIIAGDHNQLPPTILSEKAAKQGLSVTLMERLIKLHGETIKQMLTIQYRMHEVIMQWPSLQLYDNKLLAHESVQNHLLKDLPHVETNEDTSFPLILIDTDGCDLYELPAEDEESKGNEGEADLVHTHVKSLLQSGLLPTEIAVITPYNLQVELIKSRFHGEHANLEIKSVDGFQGREKEAVILSLVRSNQSGEVGFLSEDRRINVAITRAKRSLTVICDSRTVSNSPFLKSFISYCEVKGEVRSAHQYADKVGHYAVPQKKKPSQEPTKEKARQKKPKNKSVMPKEDSSCETPIRLQPQKKYEEAEKISIEEKYRQIILDFLESSDTSYSFSIELTPFERRVVHEISEELKLIHISEGENSHRFIKISKTNIDEKPKQVLKETVSDVTKVEKPAPVLKEVKKVLEVNKKTKTANLSSNKMKNKISKIKDCDEDFDSLITEVMKSDRTCSYNNCKKSVTVLGQICQFCKLTLCFSHFMPEIHGCGPLAKAQARSQIRKDGVLYPGSGRPEKKKDPIKQAYLKKKLNEKIGNLESQRKAKLKKEEK